MSRNFGWSWLAAISFYPILVLIAWPVATLLAYIGVRSLDVPHALSLILQALWFISPVYFDAKLFRTSRLHLLVDYNPIYYILEIIRSPLLRGAWPTLENYAYCFGTILVFTLLAWGLGCRAGKGVIFYL